ncbi:hypothetical protein D3C74_390800 [compost metagenome]
MKDNEGAKAKANANPTLAPALSPSNPESASGLRVIPCIIAPATAKQAPTTAPANARGILSSRIT